MLFKAHNTCHYSWILMEGSIGPQVSKRKSTICYEGFVSNEDAKVVIGKLGLWSCSSSSKRSKDNQLLEEGVYRLLEEKEASLTELEEAFTVFDEDGDGFMNQRDLFRVMNKLGFEGVKVEECKKMIKVYDLDGDGCISFKEFRFMLECAT
ncbi:probable calcium-binding protein CML45 isoform X2 [Dioscorea cayenensis subsp. rotundata]|uniref:Probable calcium-binding protein CML45 isoform X2 n=1 Tax=Dioscorea cayennensis subsp. rotundata TaxID=55577 RepID=A0AB40BRC6_DIOCR|nr:probable calcium-binding protein CML45 isoform X2 [Dioscorea cayenensis subsp. rotundata]